MANTTITHADLRRSAWEDKVVAMRDGRKQKAATFRAAKGKGSYRRKGKHGASW